MRKEALEILHRVFTGRVRYIAAGVCAKCGHVEEEAAEFDRVPSVADLLKAVELTLTFPNGGRR